MDDLRYIEQDGEYFVSVRDLAAILLATHDELTEQGEESNYQAIATSIAFPFMELAGVTPGLHTSPEGAARADG